MLVLVVLQPDWVALDLVPMAVAMTPSKILCITMIFRGFWVETSFSRNLKVYHMSDKINFLICPLGITQHGQTILIHGTNCHLYCLMFIGWANMDGRWHDQYADKMWLNIRLRVNLYLFQMSVWTPQQGPWHSRERCLISHTVQWQWSGGTRFYCTSLLNHPAVSTGS